MRLGHLPPDVARLSVPQALAMIGVGPGPSRSEGTLAASMTMTPAAFAAMKVDAAFRKAASLAGLAPATFAALDGAAAAAWLEKGTGVVYPPDKVACRLSEWAGALKE